MTLEELRARLAAIGDRLRAIDGEAGDAALSAEQQTEFDALIGERAEREAAVAAWTVRNAERTRLAGEARNVPDDDDDDAPAPVIERGDGTRGRGPNGRRAPADPMDVVRDTSLTGSARQRQLAEALLRANEVHIDGTDNQRHFERTVRRHAATPGWAENLLARSTDTYRDAWQIAITSENPLMSMSDEQRAAIAVGTNTAGGYLVPTYLDPTLIFTNAGSENDIRRLATVKQLTVGNVWNGVTTGGATFSFDAELEETSDDTPAVGPAQIAMGKLQGFLQASIEAFDDIPGLVSDIQQIIADGIDVAEGAAFATGSGAAGPPRIPLGLFTALSAVTAQRVVSTTAATLGEVDIHALYRALGKRFRSRGSFVTNPLYALAVKRLGTSVSSSFSGDLREAVSTRWLDKPVIESDDAPTTQTTTALDQEIIFADLSQYVIVEKPGSTAVEFIPVLLGSNRRPTGSRGWWVHKREGAGMPNTAGGVILVDKTSA